LEKVAVLLVNYGQWELTRQCLASLAESRGVEVFPVLVDNRSSGDVPDWVAGVPGLLFRRADSNEGFTGGNNAAFRLAESLDAPWTFILNNDTTLSPDTLRILVDFLQANPDVGIVTPPVFFAGLPDTVWSAGGRFSPWRMLFRQDLFPNRGDLPLSPVETDFASGCAMMIRSSLFHELGGFRDGFFIYHEDSLLCRQVSGLNWKIYLHPGGEVLHHVSTTSGGSFSPFAVYFTHRNRFLAARECLNPLHMTVFSFYYTMMTVAKTFLYPLQGRGRLVRWMWKAWLHGVSGRAGGTFPALEATRGIMGT
jgi:GT2 family glycosyltransferase